MNIEKQRIPIAKCPNKECGCAILYSRNGKDKLKVTLRAAESDYKGPTILCARCKTMIRIILHSKEIVKYTPIANTSPNK